MPVTNVAEVSHAVRTSLATMQGFMEILESSEALPEAKRREYLIIIHAATADLETGLRGLLNDEGPRSAA